MAHPSAFYRRWVLQTDQTDTATTTSSPTIKFPITLPHHFIHLWRSLCHNMPSTTFWRQLAAVAAELRSSASISLSGHQVAIPVDCQSRDCVQQLGIPSCRGPNLKIGAILRYCTAAGPWKLVSTSACGWVQWTASAHQGCLVVY